jgi:hypothetical protein
MTLEKAQVSQHGSLQVSSPASRGPQHDTSVRSKRIIDLGEVYSDAAVARLCLSEEMEEFPYACLLIAGEKQGAVIPNYGAQPSQTFRTRSRCKVCPKPVEM